MKSFLIKNSPLLVILLISAFIRFYHLGQVPPGLFMDEASNGYNAYSILKTGKDEYGNFLPLTIKAFGDYNPALSTYLLIPSIAVFGLTNFAVRFPSAFFGTLTVLLTYFLAKELFGEDTVNYTFKFKKTKIRISLAIIATLFMAIIPWHIQFSRYDHEANFLIFFSALGIWTLLKSKKSLLYLLASAFSFGLAFNTYHSAKVWVPLLVLSLAFWYKKDLLKYGIKIFYPLLILFIFSLPIILNFKSSLIRGQSVGIFHEQNPLLTFVNHYLSHYSLDFLFLNGDKIPRHTVFGTGPLYIFMIPIILIGIISLIKIKSNNAKFLLTWLLIAPIPASLANPAPHVLRSSVFLPVLPIIAALGLITVLKLSIEKYIKIALFVILMMVATYNLFTYFHTYYKHYPKERARDWQDGYEEMVKYVDKIKENYTSIAITDFYNHPYIFVLFYTKYNPSAYQPQSQDKNYFDKYEFFGASWKKTKEGKALIITPYWQPHPPKVLKEIYARNGDLTFVISETE